MNALFNKNTTTRRMGILVVCICAVVIGYSSAMMVSGATIYTPTSAPPGGNTDFPINVDTGDQFKTGNLGISAVATYGGNGTGLSSTTTTNPDTTGSVTNQFVTLGRVLFGNAVAIVAGSAAPGYSSGWTHNTSYGLDVDGLLSVNSLILKTLQIPTGGTLNVQYLTPTPTGTPAEYALCVQNATGGGYTAGDIRTCSSVGSANQVAISAFSVSPTTLTGSGTVTISYTVQNASGCQAVSGPGFTFNGTPLSNGTMSSSDTSALLDENVLFSLMCYNGFGSMDVKSATVTVN